MKGSTGVAPAPVDGSFSTPASVMLAYLSTPASVMLVYLGVAVYK